MTYEHGLITWTDLSSPDIEAATAFYGGLMDWEADEIEYEGEPVYTMFRHGGGLAAGMGEQSAEMAQQGIPPLWTTYVNVDSVDQIAEAFADPNRSCVNSGSYGPPVTQEHDGRRFALF